MKYLLLPANSDSEWDVVEFALVSHPEELFQKFTRAQEVLGSLEKEFDVLQIYGDYADFYPNGKELPEGILIDECSVVELSDEQIEKLSTPEQDIKYGHLDFNKHRMRIVGFGKHTNEEFWASIEYDQLKSLLNAKES